MEDIPHYYGSKVRRLFLAGAVLMLLTLPFFNSVIPIPFFFSLIAIVVLSLIAGFTSPIKRWAIAIDEVIALIAVVIFEYYASVYYTAYSPWSALFIIDQILALIFLVALYYNTKTLRESNDAWK